MAQTQGFGLRPNGRIYVRKMCSLLPNFASRV